MILAKGTPHMRSTASDGGTTSSAAGGARCGLGLTGLDHVGITVPDIEEATRFLVDVIGCEYLYSLGPLQDSDGSWMADHLNVHPRAIARTIRFFRCGANPVLEVFEYSSPDQETRPPRNSDVGGHHVAFYVEDLDAAVSFLRRHHVEVLGQPTESRGAHTGQRWVYFLAPWGAQFELVSYPNGRAWYLEHAAHPEPAPTARPDIQPLAAPSSSPSQPQQSR